MEIKPTRSLDSDLALTTDHDQPETPNTAVLTESKKKRKRDRRKESRKRRMQRKLGSAEPTSTPVIETQLTVTSVIEIKTTEPLSTSVGIDVGSAQPASQHITRGFRSTYLDLANSKCKSRQLSPTIKIEGSFAQTASDPDDIPNSATHPEHHLPDLGSAKSTSPDVGIDSPQYPTPPSDFPDDSDVEETIITQGAQATLSRPSKLAPKAHLQALAESGSEESRDEELGDSDGEHEAIRPHRPIGFPNPDDLPEWFPKNIKNIYEVDRHGGALSFKELNEITRYRAALEIIRRRKWKTYIKAGEARYKLQKTLCRLRARPLTETFLQYRSKQYQLWMSKALKSWKRLEKTHLGVSILDSTIDINFRQERIIYEKKLGGRL